MRQCPREEPTARGQVHTQRRGGRGTKTRSAGNQSEALGHDGRSRRAASPAVGLVRPLVWSGRVQRGGGYGKGLIRCGPSPGSRHRDAELTGRGGHRRRATPWGLLLNALVQLYPVSFEPFPPHGEFTKQKTGQATSSAPCPHSMGSAAHPAPIPGAQTRRLARFTLDAHGRPRRKYRILLCTACRR
jgi:hypothetical protein